MVSAVYDKEKKMKVALKKIKLSRKNQGLPGASLREVAILKSLNHPNIVKYLFCEIGFWMFFMITKPLVSHSHFSFILTISTISFDIRTN